MVTATQRLMPALVLALGLGALGGCASAGGTMRAGDVSDPDPVDSTGAGECARRQRRCRIPPRHRRRSAPAPRNSAAVALQAQAASEKAAGNPEQAASTLERAVRIEPDDAELWLALARLRLDQGQPQLARELARRAESLAPSGSGVRRRARDLQQQAATGGGPR